MESTFEKLKKLYDNDTEMPLPSRKCEKCGNCFGPCCPSVGQNYDNKENVPKLLIISLDNAGGDCHGVNEITESLLDPKKNAYLIKKKKKTFNPHWRETLSIANIILNPFIKENHLIEDKIKRGRNYFSHTNSAKCKQQIKNKNSSPYSFFYNCRSIVLKDVEAFAPDIIVTQGKNATLWMKSMKPEEIEIKKIPIKATIEKGKNKGEFKQTWKVIEVNGRKILVIPMAHPTSRKAKWPDGKSRGGLWYAQKQLVSEKENIAKIKEIIEKIKENIKLE